MRRRYIAIVILAILFIIIIILFSQTKDYDCRDFKTQKEAQEVFQTSLYDRYDLDRNRNGIACENLP